MAVYRNYTGKPVWKHTLHNETQPLSRICPILQKLLELLNQSHTFFNFLTNCSQVCLLSLYASSNHWGCVRALSNYWITAVFLEQSLAEPVGLLNISCLKRCGFIHLVHHNQSCRSIFFHKITCLTYLQINLFMSLYMGTISMDIRFMFPSTLPSFEQILTYVTLKQYIFSWMTLQCSSRY